LPKIKLNQDLELYRGKVEKMNKLIDGRYTLVAERKKRQKQAEEKNSPLWRLVKRPIRGYGFFRLVKRLAQMREG